MFGSEREVILEIGFGNGDFLINLATTRPDAHVIGVEISNKSLEKAEHKIARLGLDNAAVIHGRGETTLHHIFGPQSIDEIYINYPDPWFKARHSGRRIMQRDTLDAIVNRLKPSAYFFLATDIVDYAQMSHELLSETPGLVNQFERPWMNELTGRFITKYELKGLREGRPGNYFVYRRNDIPAPEVPVIKDLPMPHMTLTTPLSPAQILSEYNTARRLQHDPGADIHVSVLAAFTNHDQTVLLFELHIDEPTIEQHLTIMLFPQEEPGHYTLRYTTIGNPRPTEGLHRATEFLGDWIAGLHADSVVTGRKVRSNSASR